MEAPKSARAPDSASCRRMRRAACLCASARCASCCPTYSRTYWICHGIVKWHHFEGFMVQSVLVRLRQMRLLPSILPHLQRHSSSSCYRVP